MNFGHGNLLGLDLDVQRAVRARFRGRNKSHNQVVRPVAK